MEKNYGIQNEYDFIELFNDKSINELDNNSKLFIKDLFGEELDPSIKFNAWKNRIVQKTDIFIKYNNIIKNISIKCGNSNSIHQESIQNFRLFLEKLRIPYETIKKYVNYHYGYKKDENGELDFSKTLSSEEYKSIYQKELDEFNIEINKTKIIIEMIDRFIIKGRIQEYDVDALVCGRTDDYVWIKKNDIYDLILSKRNNEYTSPHIACLTIGPKKRNLDRNSKNAKDRYIVCIRWNLIKENIIDFKNGLDKKDEKKRLVND